MRYVWIYSHTRAPHTSTTGGSPFENIRRLRADVNGEAMIMRLGEKVRLLRQHAGMTQTELAEQAGLSSKGYISDVESGKKIPPAERILKLAMIFHVTTDFLLRDDLTTPEDKANAL